VETKMKTILQRRDDAGRNKASTDRVVEAAELDRVAAAGGSGGSNTGSGGGAGDRSN
jgi:hypothetical protein